MAASKQKQTDASLPFAALQVLAPPVRLVSAALWKVMTQRDVTQYGVLEEFVTSACETCPGLLTLRHQGKLALGLRARLILELCREDPDRKEVETHLKRIRAPTHPTASVARKDVKVIKTVESFHELVNSLLTDPTAKEEFFREEFPVDYGPVFDQELEKLLWEFLIRLDQLLPVPTLHQTVSWLSDAPSVLEECARAATQPQLLRVLLQHQTCLGHLEPAASLPPNMGESILSSLSIPLSGKVPSRQPTGESSADPRDRAPAVTPVFGLISNEDVPFMISAGRKKRKDEESAASSSNGHSNRNFTVVKEKGQKTEGDGGTEGKGQLAEEKGPSWRCSGLKRKQPDERESDAEEEEEEHISLSGKKRLRESGRDGDRAAPPPVRLPADPSLRSIFVSCLNNQPRVLLQKMSLDRAVRGGKSATPQPDEARKSAVTTPTRRSWSQRPQKLDFSTSDNKENHPVTPSNSAARQWSHSDAPAPPGDGEDDYVADSEDEAIKNFKGRLFVKRYYKTKHGTYVPTLREFWKPGATQQISSLRSKRR